MDNQYKKFLAPDEKVIKVFEYANAEIIWDLLCGVIPTLLIAFLTGFDMTAVLVGIPLIGFFALTALYKKYTLKYIVTDRRVLIKRGLIGQSTISADYSKVTDVTVKQGILGRLFLHTGTIVLNTAGTHLNEVTLQWVDNPFEAKNIIYEQLHKK